jgi:hypothetical protein
VVTGYEEVDIQFTTHGWGGLEREVNGEALLDGSVNSGNWWYAVGSNRFHGGGFPGPGLVVNVVELYGWCGADTREYSWESIVDEAPAGGAEATSWSDTEVTDTVAGLVHGPWGNNVLAVSREITIPSGVQRCRVSWRSWAIDSRDGETDRLLLDNVEVWTASARHGDKCTKDGWSRGPTDFPQYW